ncbi:hypothetical protein RN001_010271 [Aquatica leii]|uniref:Ran-GTPase activating protein 1 C-terminal domain-containing protein n=1 Tax=Aquatica leii TaxID=1421715 RepID=A0AAN7P0N8_9COLE|nr:hypothetical protein RN001_010271 [Aquatica leii]
MTSKSVDLVIAALEKAKVSPNTLSFENRSLKLNYEEDAKVIVEEILKFNDLECLNLEGNTLGVDAAKAIAKALETQPNFKRALWKDMFTGRMKTEIPIALQHLGNGLVKAGARLVELDLSDNAFGPIGVEGLASLLKSSSCYALEELRLNNNGLGITGGKLLAEALLDCHKNSTLQGKALSLKIFIAGRNRLENDGAKALAKVFKTLGTLEEIVMPQNGIYHEGIEALSQSFVDNKNLQVLNLNDNTIGREGAAAIAKVLPHLQKLKSINFGDCLLKTNGSLALANSLKTDHVELEELILCSNEISIKGGIAIITAMKNKDKLKNLSLDGNYFNGEDKLLIMEEMKKIGRYGALGSLEECESEDEEEEEHVQDDSEHDEDVKTVTYENFVNMPTAENFLNMGGNRENVILNEFKKSENFNDMLPLIMRISAFTIHNQEEIVQSAIACSKLLYKELYVWAEKNDNIPLVNNNILVHLGLIKSEDKKFKCLWNTDNCISALKLIMNQNCIPCKATEILNFFIEKHEKKELK